MARDGFFLVVSRLLPYKNLDRLFGVFAERPDLELVVVGTGPLRKTLQQMATPNIDLLGNVNDRELCWLYGRSRALIAPAYEDYGLTPLEAASFGKPTLALKKGGYLETVSEGTSGYFFEDLDVWSISAAIDKLSENPLDSDEIREHAVPVLRRTIRQHAETAGLAASGLRSAKARPGEGGDHDQNDDRRQRFAAQMKRRARQQPPFFSTRSSRGGAKAAAVQPSDPFRGAPFPGGRRHRAGPSQVAQGLGELRHFGEHPAVVVPAPTQRIHDAVVRRRTHEIGTEPPFMEPGEPGAEILGCATRARVESPTDDLPQGEGPRERGRDSEHRLAHMLAGEAHHEIRRLNHAGRRLCEARGRPDRCRRRGLPAPGDEEGRHLRPRCPPSAP